MKSLLVTLMLLLSAPIFNVSATATADGQTDTSPCHAVNTDREPSEAPTESGSTDHPGGAGASDAGGPGGN